MTATGNLSLAEALERAADALPRAADAIRPANGNPVQLRAGLAPSDATAVLQWLLTHETPAAAELAAAWSEDSGDGSEVVLALDESALPREGRKVLRRLRHRLRSRGVQVPDASPPPGIAKLPPVEEPLELAVISPLDPYGARIAYLVESNPAGGVRLFQVVLDGDRGIERLEVYTAARGKVRRLIRDLTRGSRFGAVEVPLDSARALVARWAARQPDARPLPRGFAEWRSHVSAPTGAAETPGEIARRELGGPGDAEAARAEALVKDRTLGPWPPAPEEIQKVAERLIDAGTGRVIVSGARRAEHVSETLSEAARELFTPDAIERTAERFEETAYVLWKSGNERDARACLAGADALRASAPAGAAIARAIMEAALAPVLQQIEKDAAGPPEEAADSTSLIVKP